MSKYAKQANADFAKLSPQEIRTAGEEEVDKVRSNSVQSNQKNMY